MFRLTEYNRSLLVMLPVSLLILLFSFPKIEPEFTGNLDGSYMWALNYLLHQNYDALRNLVYPFGPLGFLKHPVAIENNVLTGLVFNSFVKLVFVYQLLLLGFKASGRIKGSHLLTALIISYFSVPDFSIIGGCVVSLLMFFQSRHKGYFSWAVLLAMVGLCIKISIGINAGAAIFVFLLINFYYQKSKAEIAWLTGIAILIALAVGLLVFRSLSLFIAFLYNALRLATGFGDALSLHPDNNWWLLSVFILTIAAVPFVLKKRLTIIAYLLLLLPLFATWKHAMAREDGTHARLLLFFVFIFWGIIGQVTPVPKIRLFVLSSVCILAFYANMFTIPGFTGYKVEVAGIHNFTETLADHKNFVQQNILRSEENIKPYKLDSAFIARIGTSPIDIYPFDFGFVPANGLNFRPRSTLQAGAFATWYDLEEAASFTHGTGPEFVLLHLSQDQWGNWFGNYDNRHLFNDEPHTIYTLLNNYEVALQKDNLLLLQKSAEPNLTEREILQTENHLLNTWIKVPEAGNGFLRAKTTINTTLLYKLKSFLFKGEQFFIDYRLENGKILTYRFANANAPDGLWVNPFFLDPGNPVQEPEVTQIRLRSTNNNLLQENIGIAWEVFSKAKGNNTRTGNSQSAGSMFGKHASYKMALLHASFTGFENPSRYWPADKTRITEATAFTGSKSYFIPPQGFSDAFSISADSVFTTDNLAASEVEIEVWYKMGEGEATMVVESTDKQDQLWQGQPFRKPVGPDNWAVARQKTEIAAGRKLKGNLKAYIWNTSSDTVFIDDFRIEIRKKMP